MKKIFSIIVSISLMINSSQASANEFMIHAKGLVEGMHKLGESQLLLKMNSLLFTELSFSSGLLKQIEMQTTSYEESINEIKTKLNRFELLSDTINATNYSQLVASKLELDGKLNNIRENLKSSLNLISTIESRRGFYGDFCSDFSHNVDAKSIVYLPLNFDPSNSIDYTRYRSLFTEGENGAENEFFSGDPVVNGGAIFAFATSLVVSYLIIKGISLKAFLATFTINVTYTSGGTAAGAAAGGSAAASGTFAASALTIFAVIIIIASAWTYYENERRRAEAEAKYNEKVDEFEAAKSWYYENKIKQEEYEKLALTSCQSTEPQKLLIGSKETYNQLLLEIKKFKIKINNILNDVELASKALSSKYELYKESLGQIMTEQELDKIRSEALDELKIKEIWQIYNEQIKQNIKKTFANLRKSNSSCAKINNTILNLKDETSQQMKLFENGQTATSHQQVLSDIQTRITVAIQQIEERYSNCQEEIGGVVYDF